MDNRYHAQAIYEVIIHAPDAGTQSKIPDHATIILKEIKVPVEVGKSSKS
jgi:hypothetical protein